LQRYESARVSEQLRANSITIVEPAYLSTSPSSPNKKLNLILGLFGGLVIGVGLAFLLETFKTSIRSVEEVQELTGLPILCQVPRRSQTLLTLLRRRQALAKQSLKPANIVPYHRLRVTLLSSNAISRGNTLMISSAEPGAGKSTTAAGLAVALAEAGNRVIVVDADFRRFGLSRIFGMNGKVGMGEVLTEKTALAAAVHNTLWPKLRILPAGQVFREATGKIPSDQIWQILKQLRQECDYVVIDSPALLSIADATILAKQADAVVMLAALRHTEPSDLRFALQHLAEVKAKTVGIVINRAPKSRKDTYYSRR
jgi:capsular exopolysaccharide synthesis family protein